MGGKPPPGFAVTSPMNRNAAKTKTMPESCGQVGARVRHLYSPVRQMSCATLLEDCSVPVFSETEMHRNDDSKPTASRYYQLVVL